MNNPVSKTAYYTLACRYWDAQKATPVCNDSFAHIFMDTPALEMTERFKAALKPNASIVVRHQIISELLDNELAQNSSLQIINIGCGFDTRPYRHRGGQWVEVDEPFLIAHKNARLPVSETKNQLTRISLEFGHESLKEKLAPYSSAQKVVVIAEGITMYLEKAEQYALLDTLTELFPYHFLLCDLMSLSFFLKYAQELHHLINTLGASFKALEKHPQDIFHKCGYRTINRISAPLRSAELASIDIPPWLIRCFMPVLRNGLCVYEFGYGAE